MAGNAGAIRASRAFVELFADDSRLAAGLKAASAKLRAWGASITRIGATVAGAGAAIAGGFLAATKSAINAGSALLQMSQRTGISIEALSELQFATEQSGASLEVLEIALKMMAKNLLSAADGSKEAAGAFEALGLDLTALLNLSPEEQFTKIAMAVADIEDPTRRAGLALKVFGKSGTNLLPLLSDGVRGMETLRQKARDLGLTMSTQDAVAAEKLGGSWEALWAVVKRGSVAIGTALVPALTQAAATIVGMISPIGKWLQQNQELVATAFKVVAGVTAAGVAIAALGVAVSTVGTAFGLAGAVVTGFGAALGVIGSLLGAILTPLGAITTGVVALGGVLLQATGAGGAALQWLGERFNELKAIAITSFQAIGQAMAAGDLALAGKVLWLSLKMLWIEGVASLESIWFGFKTNFLKIWSDAVHGAALVINNLWAGIQTAWVETTAFLSTTWSKFISFFIKAWNSATAFLQKAWAKVKELISGEDSSAAIAAIDADAAAEADRIAADLDRKLQERDDARAARRAQIERDHAAVEQGIIEDSTRATRQLDQERQAALEATRQQAEEVKRAWQDAVGQASAARDAAADALPGNRGGVQIQADGLEDAIDTMSDKVVKAVEKLPSFLERGSREAAEAILRHQFGGQDVARVEKDQLREQRAIRRGIDELARQGRNALRVEVAEAL